MSLKYRDSQGNETPVAGLNGTSGELVPSVSLYQTGSFEVPAVPAGGYTNSGVISLQTPFPDTDYIITFDFARSSLIAGAIQKSASNFKVIIGNIDPIAGTGASTCYWKAYKLMTDEADSAHISQNTANFAPAFSELTSYAVGDYVTYNNVLYRCTTAHTAGAWVAGHFTQVTVGGDLSEIVPSNASASNKLAATSNIYNLSSYGGYATGTKTWWKIPNLFVVGADFTYRTNVFLLSSKEGGGTALLAIGDNGSNTRSAKIIMLNGTLDGVADFYFDNSTCSLYYSIQWSRLQIVQLSGQKIDIVDAVQSSSAEAAQYTAITPSITADINSITAMFGIASDTSSVTVRAPNNYAIKNYVVTVYTSGGLYAASLYIRMSPIDPNIFEIIKSEVVETQGSPAPAPSFTVSRASGNTITISVSNVSNLTSLIVSV